MSPVNPSLAFEQPIFDLEARLEKLEASEDKSPEMTEELRRLRRELTSVTRRIYASLSPWETVQVARHQKRPQTSDYISMVFDEFVELHGDRCFGDDRAIRTGFAKLEQYKVMLIGHQKGHDPKERISCYFG